MAPLPITKLWAAMASEATGQGARVDRVEMVATAAMAEAEASDGALAVQADLVAAAIRRELELVDLASVAMLWVEEYSGRMI